MSGLILGLVGVLYLATSCTPVIFDDNEGLYAGAVREMHQRGDWLMPTNNGFPRVQKPPLVYWGMLVSTEVLGRNEFALRLPNTLATLAWIFATYLILRRLGGESLGLASALTLASMLGVCIFTHLIQPEPFLAATISLSFWCLLEARWTLDWNSVKERWIQAFWVFLALGVLSKGLHGALWPLGTVILCSLFVPVTRPWLRLVWTKRGVGLFLLIVLPWYLYMAWKLPHFLSAHFVNEQLGASLNMRFPPDAKQLPVWQFYAQHLLFWLPWTLLLPGAIYVAITKRYDFSSNCAQEAIALLVTWVGLTMVSVAFSTRQDYYSMSCWGMIAAFLSLPWLSHRWPNFSVPRAYLVVPALILAGAGLLSLGLTVWLTPLLQASRANVAPIEQRDTFADALAGISPGLWAQFLPMLALFGVAMVLGGSGAAWLSWHRRHYQAMSFSAGIMAVPFTLAAVGFTLMSSYFSLAENARAINAELAQQPGAIVSCEALPNTASSLLCYLRARVHWVNAPFNNQYAQQVLGEGRDYYWNEAELEKNWAGEKPLYLIIEESRLAYWQEHLRGAPLRRVHHSGTRLVLCNR